MSESGFSVVLGSTRLVDTSLGLVGVELGLLWRRGEVLPWFNGRWVSPDRTIKFKRGSSERLARALQTAGLPEAEAATIADSVLREWAEKVAQGRAEALARRTEPYKPPRIIRAVPPVFAATWAIGAGYLVRRAWRVLS